MYWRRLKDLLGILSSLAIFGIVLNINVNLANAELAVFEIDISDTDQFGSGTTLRVFGTVTLDPDVVDTSQAILASSLKFQRNDEPPIDLTVIENAGGSDIDFDRVGNELFIKASGENNQIVRWSSADGLVSFSFGSGPGNSAVFVEDIINVEFWVQNYSNNCYLLGTAVTGQGQVTVFTSRSEWEAAVNNRFESENFNAAATGAFVEGLNTVNDLTFNAVNVQTGFSGVFGGAESQNIDGSNFVQLIADGAPIVRTVDLIFPKDVFAWAMDFNEVIPGDETHISFGTEIIQTDITTFVGGAHSGFVGFVADHVFDRVTFSDPFISFAQVGIDNVAFATPVPAVRGTFEANGEGFVGNDSFVLETGDIEFYEIQYDGAATLTIDTLGSNFNTHVGLYDACGNLVSVNDDIGAGLQSRLQFTGLDAGTYYLSIGAFFTTFGSTEFNVTPSLDGPGGIALVNVATAPANDTYFGPQLDLPFSESAANFGATTQDDEQQLSVTGATVWWFFVAPENGTVSIDTVGSDFDTQLHIYDGFFGGAGPGDLNLVASNNDVNGGMQSEVTFEVVAGECYDIRVGGFFPFGTDCPAAIGNIVLNGAYLPEFPLGDVNCDGVVNLLDVAPFVDAIASGVFNEKADLNRDSVVNLLDVGPFIDLLSG